MELHSIRLKLIIRILLLGASIFFVAYLIFGLNQYVRAAYAAVIPIIIIVEIIKFLDRNNQRINDFFNSILWDDYSISLPQNLKTKSYNDLSTTVNQLNNKLLKLRKDNFAQLFFIESLVNEALIGLLVIDSKSQVFFVNKSFEGLTGKKIRKLQPINKEHEFLWSQIKDIKINEKRAIDISMDGVKNILLFQTSQFVIEKENYRLFSVQSINLEVENTEIETWKKLIRVLSHEILNTTTPILSLSHTLYDIAQDKSIEQNTTIDKLSYGLKTIIERSSGLVKFTDAFQKISKIPEPEKVQIDTNDLFLKITSLFDSQFKTNGIEFFCEIYPNADKLYADKYQIEQVMINLIKNAIDAVKGTPKGVINIKISRALSDSIHIEVIDNGHGIHIDKMNQIFTPFFTTKVDGNGIGLAFSKQVMKLHNGDINLFSEHGNGTRVILNLPSKKNLI
ncbi:MAG: sensor histidine kinase [Bacteroidales bacterium]|nr:MAG: sensor histidine kinase [Bacteroidales bacterium]